MPIGSQTCRCRASRWRLPASDGTMHHDLGADYFEKRDRDRLVRRAVSRLQHLGYRVSLEEVA